MLRWQRLNTTVMVSNAFRSAGLAPCLVCAEPVRAAASLCCESHGHRMCADCVNGYVGSLTGTSMIADRAGGLPCIAADGTHGPAEIDRRPNSFERPAVEKLLVGATLARYLEEVSRAQAEGGGAASIDAGLGGDGDAHSAAAEIPPAFVAGKVTEALNYTCPACQTIVDPDPDGCIAMRCARCKRGFCWVCFLCCGTDAHDHCRTEHGSYFPPRFFIKRWHRRLRWVKIDALLQRAAAPPGSERRAEILQHCQQLLEDEDVRLWPFPPAEPEAGSSVETSLPHIHAAQFGRLEEVNDHLDADPDLVDQTDDRQMTALMGAAHGGHVAIVETLLLRGAAPTLRDDHGVSALDYAIRQDHKDVVVFILRSAAAEGEATFASLFERQRNGLDTLIECFCWAEAKAHHDVLEYLEPLDRIANIRRWQVVGTDKHAPAGTSPSAELSPEGHGAVASMEELRRRSRGQSGGERDDDEGNGGSDGDGDGEDSVGDGDADGGSDDESGEAAAPKSSEGAVLSFFELGRRDAEVAARGLEDLRQASEFAAAAPSLFNFGFTALPPPVPPAAAFDVSDFVSANFDFGATSSGFGATTAPSAVHTGNGRRKLRGGAGRR